ncbi:hypothetical protein CCR75_007210 [Bremia lactucae]|uniref:PX domain-containing protein n=1 Tax=Bremia lactucae TaxID=4779 RepID=A0A976IDS0_BRELC|nr:hypothetical protein CCR75_007210 [Bremia lactucae]
MVTKMTAARPSLATLSARVTGHDFRTFYVYTTVVTLEGASWSLAIRYSKFLSFYDALRSAERTFKFDFPPRGGIFSKPKPDERQVRLDAFLQAVTKFYRLKKQPPSVTRLLCDFLLVERNFSRANKFQTTKEKPVETPVLKDMGTAKTAPLSLKAEEGTKALVNATDGIAVLSGIKETATELNKENCEATKEETKGAATTDQQDLADFEVTQTKQTREEGKDAETEATVEKVVEKEDAVMAKEWNETKDALKEDNVKAKEPAVSVNEVKENEVKTVTYVEVKESEIQATQSKEKEVEVKENEVEVREDEVEVREDGVEVREDEVESIEQTVEVKEDEVIATASTENDTEELEVVVKEGVVQAIESSEKDTEVVQTFVEEVKDSKVMTIETKEVQVNTTETERAENEGLETMIEATRNEEEKDDAKKEEVKNAKIVATVIETREQDIQSEPEMSPITSRTSGPIVVETNVTSQPSSHKTIVGKTVTITSQLDDSHSFTVEMTETKASVVTLAGKSKKKKRNHRRKSMSNAPGSSSSTGSDGFESPVGVDQLGRVSDVTLTEAQKKARNQRRKEKRKKNQKKFLSTM